jgi:hypothetical protein
MSTGFYAKSSRAKPGKLHDASNPLMRLAYLNIADPFEICKITVLEFAFLLYLP